MFQELGPYINQSVVIWSFVGARRFVDVPPLPSGTGAMNVEKCGKGQWRKERWGTMNGMEWNGWRKMQNIAFACFLFPKHNIKVSCALDFCDPNLAHFALM